MPRLRPRPGRAEASARLHGIPAPKAAVERGFGLLAQSARRPSRRRSGSGPCRRGTTDRAERSQRSRPPPQRGSRRAWRDRRPARSVHRRAATGRRRSPSPSSRAPGLPEPAEVRTRGGCPCDHSAAPPGSWPPRTWPRLCRPSDPARGAHAGSSSAQWIRRCPWPGSALPAAARRRPRVDRARPGSAGRTSGCRVRPGSRRRRRSRGMPGGPGRSSPPRQPGRRPPGAQPRPPSSSRRWSGRRRPRAPRTSPPRNAASRQTKSSPATPPRRHCPPPGWQVAPPESRRAQPATRRGGPYLRDPILDRREGPRGEDPHRRSPDAGDQQPAPLAGCGVDTLDFLESDPVTGLDHGEGRDVRIE